MLAVCTDCNRTITVEEPGWQSCKFCGRRVWVPDPMNPEEEPGEDPQVVAEKEAAEQGIALDIPWESSLDGGFLKRFFSTVGRVLFKFNEFFARLPNYPYDRRATIYGWMMLTIGLIQFFQFQAISVNTMREMMRDEQMLSEIQRVFPFLETAQLQEALAEMERMKMDEQFFFLSSALSPLFAVVILWLTTRLILSAFLLTRKPIPPPYPKIRRVAAYTYTPWLFLAMPLMPLIPAMLWTWVIQYVAFRKALRLTVSTSIFCVIVNSFVIKLLIDIWIQIQAVLR